MNTQVNIRIPEKLLSLALTYSEEHGFGNIQEFIKETVREKLFEEATISKKELKIVKKLIEASEKNSLYGTEKQLLSKLKK